MALSVQTSLSYISKKRLPRKNCQGVGFFRFEHGYHLVPFNCVHRSDCQFVNLQTSCVEQSYQLTIVPSRLWRSVWLVNHTLKLSNGWPRQCTKFKYLKNTQLGNGGHTLRGPRGEQMWSGVWFVGSSWPQRASFKPEPPAVADYLQLCRYLHFSRFTLQTWADICTIWQSAHLK